MLSALDISIVAAYLIALAGFGVLLRRLRSFDDFSVAGRDVPQAMVIASLSATYIGPGFSLGLAGQGATAGFFFFFFFVFFSIQTVLMGLYVTPRLREFSDCHTLGDVMRKLYGPLAQTLTGVISVGLCVGFAAVMARAGGTILARATGLDFALAASLATGVGVLYAITGGLKSVIATEALQFCIIIAVVPLMLLIGWRNAPTDLDVLAYEMTASAWRSTSAASMFGLALSFFLGETLIPPYANRALAARSATASGRGFVLAGLFSVPWFAMMVGIGIVAKASLPVISAPDSVFMDLAILALPTGALGLLFVAVAAIIMSTQEALLNAGAVSLTRDLIRPFVSVQERQLVIGRVGTGFLATVSVWIALRAPTIIDALLVCYSLWATTVLPPLLWGVWGRRTAPLAGTMAILCGAVGAGAVLVGGAAGGDPTIAIVVGLACNLFGGVVGAMITRRGTR